MLDFDSNEYPFSRIFREALLASDSQSNANCKKEKREQRFAVMHIRAGDTTDGAYDLRTGLFVQGGPVNPNYPPYPTAFYVRALKEVKDFSVIILCETLSNPSCDFFAKLESLVDNVRVRVGGDVVEDVHLLLCASEVVTSIGSFKNLLVTLLSHLSLMSSILPL